MCDLAQFCNCPKGAREALKGAKSTKKCKNVLITVNDNNTLKKNGKRKKP